MKYYPSYVICIDDEPLLEEDGTITLYHEGDDDILKDRFFAIVYLSKDASKITIRKFDLTPHTFESVLSKEDFLKQARETKEIG
jgi:hypothetical protein